MIHCETIVGTVSGGAGTFTSLRPVNGMVVEVRQPGTAWGSTADYLLTRLSDGGTVMGGLDMAAPWSVHPAPVISSYAGGTAVAGTATAAGVPSHGHLQLVVGSAVNGVGTLHVYYIP